MWVWLRWLFKHFVLTSYGDSSIILSSTLLIPYFYYVLCFSSLISSPEVGKQPLQEPTGGTWIRIMAQCNLSRTIASSSQVTHSAIFIEPLMFHVVVGAWNTAMKNRTNKQKHCTHRVYSLHLRFYHITLHIQQKIHWWINDFSFIHEFEMMLSAFPK